MKIPDTFRPAAKAKAEHLLQGVTDEKRQRRILNEISESEWNQDRIEWRSYMDRMKAKSYQMFATPQDRVNYERKTR